MGLEAEPVTVEVSIDQGLPGLHIVGLPDKAVEESRERVRTALKQLGLAMPAKRITVNLAPADLRKEGPLYDLPIALGILVADGRLPTEVVNERRFVAELALDGALRPVRGYAVFLEQAETDGVMLVAAADQVSPSDHQACGATSLSQVIAALDSRAGWAAGKADPPSQTGSATSPLADIVGQAEAKAALIIAAAGGHHLRLVGPPGTGKTLLARALGGLLPEPTPADLRHIAKIASLLGPTKNTVSSRPFRSPHHTSSPVALVGGGSPIRPGEVTLAHLGVLFLDELPEFPRSVLEVLRQPLEERQIHLARADRRVTFPAHFQLVAAYNPCPCGYFGDPERACTCPAGLRERYLARLSGPLLDRIDLSVMVNRISSKQLLGEHAIEIDPRPQVAAARERQLQRQGKVNAELGAEDIRKLAIEPEAQQMVIQAGDKLQLSGRALHRLIKVAQTVADLEQLPIIQPPQVLRALSYRLL